MYKRFTSVPRYFQPTGRLLNNSTYFVLSGSVMNNRSIVRCVRTGDTRADYLHSRRKHTQQIELLQVQTQRILSDEPFVSYRYSCPAPFLKKGQRNGFIYGQLRAKQKR